MARRDKPWKKRALSTMFLRVENGDWVDVKQGTKREFRSPHLTKNLNVEWPMPAVAYRTSHRLGFDSCLIVVEDRWEEPLGAITPESLRNEGYETFAEFRRAWVNRHRKRFPPDRIVSVVRFRLFTKDDERLFGDKILNILYGEWL